MKKEDLKNCSSIIVSGLGISGRAALELALKKGFKKIFAFDEKESPELDEFKKTFSCDKCEIRTGWKGGTFPRADLVVASPGIADNSPLDKAASALGAPVISELEFGFLYCKTPLIAITGTNGKTTSTELTAHLLNAIGCKATCAGNIGIPLSRIVLDKKKYDFIVVEVSSFQLEKSFLFAPVSAALLNITSDHMNRYASEDDYVMVKFKIFENIKKAGCGIIRRDLLPCWEKIFPGKADPVTFSMSTSKSDYYLHGNDRIMKRIGKKSLEIARISETNILGNHNAENLMASLALLHSVVPEPDIRKLKKGICEFRTGPHRLELVRTENGVRYINDSKATNPDSVIVALRAVGKINNVCLIAGGLDKNMDFSSVLEEKHRIKKAFILGECKEKLANLWKNDISCVIFKNFENAVLAACEVAEPGDVVLLSPGCASMDMFKDYKDRGKKFIYLINRRFQSEK